MCFPVMSLFRSLNGMPRFLETCSAAMNWPWFLKPLDARSSDICAGSSAVILALSCGFAEIFAAIGFTIGARAVAPEVVVVLVEVPEAGVVIVGGVVLV